MYVEKHHIVPKSLGGTNDPSNLVHLTAREHFICHRLLVKMTIGEAKRKMAHAAWALASLNNSYQQRIKVNSRTYGKLKEDWISARKGRPGPNLGKKWTEDTRRKQSESKKGIPIGPMSDETKKKLSKPKTEEHKRKLSKARAGKSWGFTHSNETKEKMSSWQKGVSKPQVVCEHCGKASSQMNYSRWHGKNCKLYAKMF